MKPYLGGLLLGGLALSFLLLLLLGGPVRARDGSRAGPPAAIQWGPDRQVNPPSTATPSVQRNFAFALDPNDPHRVIAGYDSWDPGNSYSGYSVSTDAGQTWAGGRLYGPWISGTLPFGQAGVAIDRQGTIYYTTLATGNSSGDSAYMILTSTTGLAWSAPHPIVASPYSQYYDQGRLVLDARTSGPFAGRLYLLLRYDNTSSPGQRLRLRYSSDRGQTWSGDVAVADPAFRFSEGLNLVEANDGTLYAAYATDLFAAPKFYLHRSTDGGLTWSGGDLITGAPIAKIGALDAEGFELLLKGDDARGFRVANTPAIAVAPDNPRTVYAVWNDGRWDATFSFYGNPGQHGDIAFARSTDAGITWSAPVRVNDDAVANAVDQFSPALGVGPDGRIGVTWYDRREDPAQYLYNLYYSESTDGGATWTANTRVSDQPSDPMARTFFEGHGDLSGAGALVYGPDYVLPSWSDSRAGAAQDFYTDHGSLFPPGPTVSPSPIPAESPTPTPGVPATPTRPAPDATPTTAPEPTATVAPPVPSPTPALPPGATATPTPCSARYSDVPADAYCAAAVQWLTCRGVVAGYGDGSFRPYNPTTRGQLAKLIVLGYGWPLTMPTVPTFADLPAADPFYAFVETAVARGVINGYTCGAPGEPCPARYFRPGADVTRGQLAKIVVLAEGWAPLAPAAPTFADVPVGSPFFGYVERAAAQGLLSGYGCGGTGEPCPARYFRPAASSTRGQLSKILYNILAAP